MFNVQQITDRLAGMSDQQLQQYAQMHKDDPYILPLAASEFKRRQQIRMADQGQQAPQQTVADQDLAQMQQAAQPQQAPQQMPQQAPQPQAQQALPEDQGIGKLPAQNLVGMADGGIVGYAKGGSQDVGPNGEVQGSKTRKPGWVQAGDGLYYPAISIHPEWFGEKTPPMEAELVKRFAAADAAYFAKTGQHIPVNSAARNYKIQKDLYLRFLAGDPSVPRANNPDDDYGREQYHMNALDIPSRFAPFLRKFGLTNTSVPGDPVHYTAIEGWTPDKTVAAQYKAMGLSYQQKDKNGNLTLVEPENPQPVPALPETAPYKFRFSDKQLQRPAEPAHDHGIAGKALEEIKKLFASPVQENKRKDKTPTYTPPASTKKDGVQVPRINPQGMPAPAPAAENPTAKAVEQAARQAAEQARLSDADTEKRRQYEAQLDAQRRAVEARQQAQGQALGAGAGALEADIARAAAEKAERDRRTAEILAANQQARSGIEQGKRSVSNVDAGVAAQSEAAATNRAAEAERRRLIEEIRAANEAARTGVDRSKANVGNVEAGVRSQAEAATRREAEELLAPKGGKAQASGAPRKESRKATATATEAIPEILAPQASTPPRATVTPIEDAASAAVSGAPKTERRGPTVTSIPYMPSRADEVAQAGPREELNADRVRVLPGGSADAPTSVEKELTLAELAKKRAAAIAENFRDRGIAGGIGALIGGNVYERATAPQIRKIPAESESMFQLRQIDDPNAVRQGEQYVKDPSLIERAEKALLGTPEAVVSTATGMASPWTSVIPQIYEKLLNGKDLSAQEAMALMTFAPRSEAGQEMTENISRAFDASKLPPFTPVPGAAPGARDIYRTLTGKDKPLMTTDRAAALREKVAQRRAALEKANAPAQGELPGMPKPTEAELLRAKTQTPAEVPAKETAPLVDTQMSLFEEGALPESTIVGEYSPFNEKVRNAALKQKMRDEFRRQADEAGEAAARVRKGQMAGELKSAEDWEAAAQRQLAKQRNEAEANKSIMFDNASRQRVANRLGLAGIGAGAASDSAREFEETFTPNAEGVPREGEYTPWEDNFVSSGSLKGSSSVRDKTPTTESYTNETGGKQSRFTDDDLLMFGLQMMQAPSGQDGNEISKFLSNVGRSGIATLAARSERAKEARAETQQKAQEAYMAAMTKQLGQAPESIRMLRELGMDPSLYKKWQEMEWFKDLPTFRSKVIGDYAKLVSEGYNVPWDTYIEPYKELFYPNPPANATVTTLPSKD